MDSNISVCMATFNGSKYIREQIVSILSQLSMQDELIVSDDSSTDNTIEIIQSFKDDRIKIIINSQFKSPIFNFENAIKHASNPLIFLSDQDDVWLEDKVSEMKLLLKQYTMVVSNHTVVDENMNILIPSYFEVASSGKGVIKNIIKNTYFGCCMAFHKKILDVALPFPNDIPMHDSWLALVSDLFFDTYFIEKPLVLYRKHDNNSSTAWSLKSNYSFLRKLSFRINTIKYIPLLYYRRYMK